MALFPVPPVGSSPGQREEDAAEPPPAVAPVHAEVTSAGGPAPRVLVAVPAFNEERLIGSVAMQVQLAGFPLLVVDDGSADKTAAIASAAGALVERHERNLGKAEALNTAFRLARSLGIDVLVVLDGDGQHDACEIERIVAPVLRGDADIVIGSRFLAGSAGNIPGVRRMGQLAVTRLTNAASRTPVSDSQSGFRAFSRRAFDLLRLQSEGFGAEVEMQFEAQRLGLRVREEPIVARYLDPPRRSLLRHGTLVLTRVLQLLERHRPLMCFAVPGALCLVVAGGFGLAVIHAYQRIQELAIGYALVTVLFGSLGITGMTTGVILHAMQGQFLDLARRIAAIGVEQRMPVPERERRPSS